MRKREYWLVSTDHLEKHLLFKDTEDFRVGMNYVAVQTHCSGVSMLAFVLMSNHLHFVMEGTRAQVECFITGLKTAYSRYYYNKYRMQELLRRNGVDIRPVWPKDEALERAIAYVQMNCVAANICSWPTIYAWGTGACFFNRTPKGMAGASVSSGSDNANEAGPSSPKGRALASMSKRERYRLLHSKLELPGEWLVGEDGYILPQSYVCMDWAENLYRTPKRMNYFLNSSSKAKVRLESGEDNLPSFRDQVIAAALPDLCQSLFRKREMKELEEEQLIELMRQLRYRFSANVNQIARVMGLTYEHAAQMMDQA